jgi:flagellar biosynthesis GTPase FlhF
MWAALSSLSVIGMFVFLIMSVISVFRKKGKAKRNLKFAVGCFVLLVAVIIATPVKENDVTETASTNVKSDTTKVDIKEEEAAKIEDANEAAEQKAREEAEAKEKAEEEAAAQKLADEEAKKKAEEDAIKKAKEEEKQKTEEAATAQHKNVVANLNPSEVADKIKEKAEADWGTDFEMVKYQMENQTEAYNSLINLEIDAEYKEILLTNALNDWIGDFDFEMIEYQYDNQIKAYNWIQNEDLDSDVKKEVMGNAKANWGNDYEMVQYEYENQMEAHKSLGN